jgi:hypothetical protein
MMYYPKDKVNGGSKPTLCPLFVAATIAHHGQIGDEPGTVDRLSCGPECGWWVDYMDACAMVGIAKRPIDVR